MDVPDPVRGSKAALILVDSTIRSARFAGLSVDLDYRAEDLAHCATSRCPVAGHHDPPHPDGACGFSATPYLPLELLTPEVALLDVELLGQVLPHEGGWRASSQRVLGAAFLRGCQQCLTPVARPLLVALVTPTVDRRLLVVPRCQACAEVVRYPSCAAPVTRAELAGLLATDVGFADEATSAAVLERAAQRRADQAA